MTLKGRREPEAGLVDLPAVDQHGSRDDNASPASLVTADGGRYGGCVPLPPPCGGCVPLPPPCGGCVPLPPLPAGTASATIQRDMRQSPVDVEQALRGIHRLA